MVGKVYRLVAVMDVGPIDCVGCFFNCSNRPCPSDGEGCLLCMSNGNDIMFMLQDTLSSQWNITTIAHNVPS
jgi:hypothetical protein